MDGDNPHAPQKTEMLESTSWAQFDQLLVSAERLGKLVAAAAAIVYVSGFVIIGVFLNTFHVSDFNLVQARYLMVGGLAWVPILIATIALSFMGNTVSIWRNNKPANSPTKGIRSLAAKNAISIAAGIFLILWVNAALIVAYDFSLNALGVTANRLMRTGLFMMAMGIASFILGVPIELQRWRRSYQEPAGNYHRSYAVLNQIYFVAFIVFYLGMFAKMVFPFVPQQFGGGAPTAVRFLFNRSDLVGLRALGVDIDPDTSVSRLMKLYYEGEMFIVTPLAGGPVVRIEKRVVDSVQLMRADQFVPPENYGAPTAANENGRETR